MPPTAIPANPNNRLRCQGWAENFSITNRVEMLLMPLNAKLNRPVTNNSQPRPGLRAISIMAMIGFEIF